MHAQMIRRSRLWAALLAGVGMALAAPPALAQNAAPATAAYSPTMADYLAVTDALQHYRFGLEKHDEGLLRSAFWPDGVNIAVPSPGLEIKMPLDGSPPTLPPGAVPPGGGPSRGAAPPPGAMPARPGMPPGGPGPAPGAGEEVWHLPLDSYIHFESATRATHYEYFLSIYPQKEKPAEGGPMTSMRDARVSIVGWPGHYEDILEKRNGEWRILSRKSMINQK